MKNSTIHLLKKEQEKLSIVVSEILKQLAQIEYIILCSNYTRNNSVNREIKVEPDRILIIKISDYDIFAIINESKKIEILLDNIKNIFLQAKTLIMISLSHLLKVVLKTSTKLSKST